MSFLRRKKDKSEDNEVPAAPQPVQVKEKPAKAPKEAGEKKGLFQGIRDYLVDSYNGLYKIFFSGYMPKTNTFMLIIVGMIIGMVWAYGVAPTTYYNSDPSQMSPIWRDEWIKLVAAANAVNADGIGEDGMYNDEFIITLLQQVENPSQNVQKLIQTETGQVQQALLSVQPLATNAGAGTEAPKPGGILSDILTWILPIIIVVIALPLLNMAWKVLIYQYVAFPVIDFFRSRFDKEYVEDKTRRKKELDQLRKDRDAQANLATTVDEELGQPMIQKLSTYRKGRKYDESFEIENAGNDFLGECGLDIGARMDDDPSAINAWMFDMFDNSGPTPGKTITKVFASKHAYNDPAMRSTLEAKVENPATDIIIAEPGAVLNIDTLNLRMRAEVTSLEYLADASPDSAFEEIQVKLGVWEKASSGASASDLPPMPQPVMPMQNTAPTSAPASGGMTPLSPPPMQPQQGGLRPLSPPPLQPQQGSGPTPLSPPPMQPPAQQPQQGGLRPLSPPPLQQPQQGSGPTPLSPPPMQPQQGGLRPLSPPPLQQPPDDDEDDPFGGTGDFTPLG